QSARAEAEAAQRRLAFLAEASQLLAVSLDYERTLQDVANLVVPARADCCFVDIREADGSVRRIASAAIEAFDEPEDDPARALTVPLLTRSGVAGAITWRVSPARAAFEPQDLGLAQDLARRCALAMDNA